MIDKERGRALQRRFTSLLQVLRLKPPSEAERKSPVPIEVIDENYPGNILSDKTRPISYDSFASLAVPFSSEGFAENPEKQTELARFLIDRFKLASRGIFLDVGFGANIHIANTFAASGVDSFAIDQQQGKYDSDEGIWHSPRVVTTNKQGVTILNGDIADINKGDSALRDKNFGTILFNGSWDASGNNWTVGGEVAEAKYHNKGDKTISSAEFVDRERSQVLKQCTSRLKPGGAVGFVSARYAFHGSGFSFNLLPEEKLVFLDLYTRLTKLGAKRVCLVGVTQKGFDEMLAASPLPDLSEIRESFRGSGMKFPEVTVEKVEQVRDQLRRIDNLPRETTSVKYGGNPDFSKKQVEESIELVKGIPEFEGLARIDALFAEI
ncbi:MAG: hypothetical protein Q7S88_03685 [Candidatus Daviesbacteria bacterium]|nr:hypothetical protein [Candidatus Daviesbacteria bacterium]